MIHKDHVNLISKAVPSSEGIWADLGSGDGAFTLALYDLLPKKSRIFSIDKDKRRLENQKNAFRDMFSEAYVQFMEADFTSNLDLLQLDGVIMANSLHYIKDKKKLLDKIKRYLKPSGRLILVEYNVDKGNYWVPYPISFETFISLAVESGFNTPELSGQIPSTFLQEIYAAFTDVKNISSKQSR